jgi:hypothetical protein
MRLGLRPPPDSLGASLGCSRRYNERFDHEADGKEP